MQITLQIHLDDISCEIFLGLGLSHIQVVRNLTNGCDIFVYRYLCTHATKLSDPLIKHVTNTAWSYETVFMKILFHHKIK